MMNVKNEEDKQPELKGRIIKPDYSFDEYLRQWDENYKYNIKKFKLFNQEVTSEWTSLQKKFFVRSFYHVRGHFYKFLWFMGNHAPNADLKSLIIDNIKEEFGNDKLSHEQLYYKFAEYFGVNVIDELLSQKTYLPFIKEFNDDHVRWLATHDWISILSAFSAYERLDNIDYLFLYDLAKSICPDYESLIFFKVHTHVNHFDQTNKFLSEAWDSQNNKIQAGYAFIANHQCKLWEQLSEAVFNHV